MAHKSNCFTLVTILAAVCSFLLLLLFWGGFVALK